MPGTEMLEVGNETQLASEDRKLKAPALGKVGRSAAKRQKAVLNLQRRLIHETRRDRQTGRIIGPNQPCTVLNFNPIELVAEIEGRRITIPPPGKFEKHQFKCQYAGREVQAHYLFVENPIIYTPIKGHEADTQLPIDVPVCEPDYFSPHAIGCIFEDQYNSASIKLMGGVLLIDQDILQLTSESLAKSGGRILVPTRERIEDSNEFVYSLRESYFEDEMERVFATQRVYCDTIIQQGHTYWSEQDINSRKMITDTHREWARYAHRMYWLPELPEWVTARISAGGPITHLIKCRYCGTQQPSLDALFCKACSVGAPYDAYKAFMAGMVVPMVFLETLEGAQLDEVMAEMERRNAKRARMESLKGTAETSSERPKPLHGAAKAAADAKAARDAAQQGQPTGNDN